MENTPEELNGMVAPMEKCVLCDTKVLSRRLCARHYNQMMRENRLDEFPKKTSEECFWEKVIKNEAGCWGWTGAIQKKGYGNIRFNGPVERTNRVSWFLHHGEWPPKGMMVCHTCDNRICTRPDHLFLGTADDNMQDAMKKGRIVVNETHWKTRLSAEDARIIRDSDESNISLAKRYGISEPHVSNIKAGRSRYRA